MSFQFVIEPTRDGCLQVRSRYMSDDLVARFVEQQLRALVEAFDQPAPVRTKRSKTGS